MPSEIVETPEGYSYHESSYIDKPAQIGRGTKIWHFTHVMKDCEIGEQCNIGQNVVVSSGVKLGRNVKIQNNVSLYTGVICEDDVFLGPSMVFTNVTNPRSHVSRRNEYKQTLVRKGATLGANCTIVCGIALGEYCLIGAGSLVAKDVKPHALMYGNPARHQGWMCQCGEIIARKVETSSKTVKHVCSVCKTKYEESNGQFRNT